MRYLQIAEQLDNATGQRPTIQQIRKRFILAQQRRFANMSPQFAHIQSLQFGKGGRHGLGMLRIDDLFHQLQLVEVLRRNPKGAGERGSDLGFCIDRKLDRLALGCAAQSKRMLANISKHVCQSDTMGSGSRIKQSSQGCRESSRSSHYLFGFGQ